jgi:hypothetical protein
MRAGRAALVPAVQHDHPHHGWDADQIHRHGDEDRRCRPVVINIEPELEDEHRGETGKQPPAWFAQSGERHHDPGDQQHHVDDEMGPALDPPAGNGNFLKAAAKVFIAPTMTAEAAMPVPEAVVYTG